MALWRGATALLMITLSSSLVFSRPLKDPAALQKDYALATPCISDKETEVPQVNVEIRPGDNLLAQDSKWSTSSSSKPAITPISESVLLPPTPTKVEVQIISHPNPSTDSFAQSILRGIGSLMGRFSTSPNPQGTKNVILSQVIINKKPTNKNLEDTSVVRDTDKETSGPAIEEIPTQGVTVVEQERFDGDNGGEVSLPAHSPSSVELSKAEHFEPAEVDLASIPNLSEEASSEPLISEDYTSLDALYPLTRNAPMPAPTDNIEHESRDRDMDDLEEQSSKEINNPGPDSLAQAPDYRPSKPNPKETLVQEANLVLFSESDSTMVLAEGCCFGNEQHGPNSGDDQAFVHWRIFPDLLWEAKSGSTLASLTMFGTFGCVLAFAAGSIFVILKRMKNDQSALGICY